MKPFNLLIKAVESFKKLFSNNDKNYNEIEFLKEKIKSLEKEVSDQKERSELSVTEVKHIQQSTPVKNAEEDGTEVEQNISTNSIKPNNGRTNEEKPRDGSTDLEKTPDKNNCELPDTGYLDNDNKPFFDAISTVLNTENSLFLTGKAGTGKTTFLKYLVENLKKTDKEYVVLAPTGIAAINAGGQTIHSFFQLGFGPYLPDDSRLNVGELHLRLNTNKIGLIESLNVIIIDEISMVRCDIIDAISKILKVIRGNTSPFGGVQMVFIGDLFQLSPVADENFFKLLDGIYRSEFFFDAQVFKTYDEPDNKQYIEYVELEKVYRQKDKDFINILNRVRLNRANFSDLNILNDRLIKDAKPHKGYITLSTHRRSVDGINRQELDKLDGELYQFNCGVDGVFPETAYPTDAILSLKIGAQVILLTNKGHLYCNGSMGVVEDIGLNCITVRLFSNNNVVTVDKHMWENVKYTYNKKAKKIEPEIIGRFFQFPIKLAWAITIHKSQGLTFDKVIVDSVSAFAHGQTYVALSRCRSLDGMLLKSEIKPKSIIVDSRVIDFTKRLKGIY